MFDERNSYDINNITSYDYNYINFLLNMVIKYFFV